MSSRAVLAAAATLQQAPTSRAAEDGRGRSAEPRVTHAHVQDSHQTRPRGAQTQPKQIQLVVTQISKQCPEAGNQLQFTPTLEKLPVYYRTPDLGWGFQASLFVISSLLLLSAGLCHNIVFHTLIPLTAHPSFFIIASNKY